MQGVTFAYVHIKRDKTFTYHEDFPDTIDGEKITQKIKVFSLESFGVLYSLLKIQKGARENIIQKKKVISTVTHNTKF